MIHYQQNPAKQKIECIDFFSIIEFIQFGCWQLLRHKIYWVIRTSASEREVG